MTGSVSRAPSGLEPVIGQLCDVREGRRPENLTTRAHTDIYMRSDFILILY